MAQRTWLGGLGKNKQTKEIDYSTMTIRAILCFKVTLHGTIRNSVAMLEQCCKHSKQCLNNVATLCCAKNRRCESSRVTSPFISLSLGAKFEF